MNKLSLSRDQFVKFADTASREVEDDLIRHVHLYFPDRVALLGPEIVREVVQLGMTRAAAQDVTSWRDVCTFLNCMWTLGSLFDADEQLAWVGAVLDRARAEHARGDMTRLADDVLMYLDEILGEDDLRIARRTLGWLHGPRTRISDLPAFLATLSPEKHRLVGERALHRAISRVESSAAARGITGEPGVTLCVALAFTTGAGLFEDPQLRPVVGFLVDAAPSDESTKVERLRIQATDYLERWIAADRGGYP